MIEHACGAAFIPRRRTETTTVGANGLIHLYMPLGREVEDITDSYGTVWITATSPTSTIVNGYVHGLKWLPGEQLPVTYTHGYDTPPARIRRAAMIATRVWTTRGPVDDRATQIAADGATVNLATPGLQESSPGSPRSTPRSANTTGTLASADARRPPPCCGRRWSSRN